MGWRSLICNGEVWYAKNPQKGHTLQAFTILIYSKTGLHCNEILYMHPYHFRAMHCKSDKRIIQTCFTKLVCNTVKIDFFTFYWTTQLCWFLPYWLGSQGVSPVGWYCPLVVNRKGLFLWGDDLKILFFVDCIVIKHLTCSISRKVCYYFYVF